MSKRREAKDVLCIAGILLFLWMFAGGTEALAAEANYPDITPGQTAVVNRVCMDGIEFFFDKAYTVGRFANGITGCLDQRSL